MLEIINVLPPELERVMLCRELVWPTPTELNERTAGWKEATGPDTTVPVIGRVCGDPAAESDSKTTAVLVPSAVGVNDTVIIQLPRDASELPHCVLSEKSFGLLPPSEILEMVSVLPPVLESVMIWEELVWPTPSEPNERTAGWKDAAGPDTAVPDRATLCGDPAAESDSKTTAVLVPSAVGVNVTLIVQFARDASEVPHGLMSEKSLGLVPPSEMLVMASAVPPVLESVTDMVLLDCPMVTVPNDRALELREACGAFPSCPVPDRFSVSDADVSREFVVKSREPVIAPT
jgi:RES domain-containing protein